ncbi:hypothetical protein CDD81_1879 [Ophiocordyceps australis]|uniref:Uncharacterized protein n=1 Tax=Ophiocordyceps australis TaxID=1399860 RepID=A0A2C5X7V8_9HYPO|nr:hypothetical protein CDD81_1879 [Ophiocordyceps australis]
MAHLEHSAGDEDSLHFQQAAASCHPAYLDSDPVPDPLFTAIMSNVFQRSLGYPGSSMASENGLYYVSGPEVFKKRTHFVVRGPGKIVFSSHKILRLKLGQVATIILHDVSVPATMIQGQRVRAFNITGLGELKVADVVYDLSIYKGMRFEPAEGMIKAEDIGCNFVPLLQHQGCLAYEPSRDVKTGDELPPHDDDEWYGRNRGSTSQQSSTRILHPGGDIASDAEGLSGEGYQKNKWRTSSGFDNDDSDNSEGKSPQSTDYEEQLKNVAAGDVWNLPQAASDLEGLSGEGYTTDKGSAAGQQPKNNFPSKSGHDAPSGFNVAETEGVTGEGYGKNQWITGGDPASDNSPHDKVPFSKSRTDVLDQPNVAEAEGVTGEGLRKEPMERDRRLL